VVLLEVGASDLYQNFQVSTMAQRLDNLVGQMVADSPTLLVCVSSILPMKVLGANQTELLQAYNTQIRDVIVPKYAGLGYQVLFVDQYANFVDQNGNIIHIGPDGIHPDQDGYDLMGATWAAALRQVLPLPVLVTGYSADVISDKDPSARSAQPFHGG